MKAVTFSRYGSPDVLEYEDVPRPVPEDDEVLIKVIAASINEWDHGIFSANMLVNRMMFGLFRPKVKTILGADVSGVVVETGKDVDLLKEGDEVFGDLSGDRWGAFAEYVCARDSSLSIKPKEMSFEEAAALPQAGLMALQCFDQYSDTSEATKTLINGGGGGVGTYAIQIAKDLGAEVTAVDSASKLDMMSSLGADNVMDFRRNDFTKTGKKYDHIIEVTGHRRLLEYRRALEQGGVCSLVGGSMWLMLKSSLLGSMGSRKISVMGYETNSGMKRMIDLFLNREVRPVIDRIYTLSETADAFRYYSTGEHKGKIVIRGE